MSPTEAVTIVLVHGAWHGPWCWKHQIPELQKFGYQVETIHLPSAQGIAGKTQYDDANAVRVLLETLLSAGKRVVVVGHSYAGPIGCAAMIGLSEQERAGKQLAGGVLGLLALCAFLFPGGMDQGAEIRRMNGLPYVVWDSPSDGLFVPKDPQSMFFPPDVPQDRADWAIPQLRPQSMAANMGIVPPQAWQEDADHYAGKLGYIVCTDDNLVSFENQMAFVDGAGGRDKWTVRELRGSSHSPFLSRPQEVASVVHEMIGQFSESTSR
ncbi:hypothetical protein MY4038_001430 [Beauveria bassiana]